MAKINPATTDTSADFRRVWHIAEDLHLPLLHVATSFGKPSMKVGKKFVGWVKLPGVLVTHCGIEFKEVLLGARPDVYFQTSHYVGWPAIEMRLDRATDDDIRDAIIRAWRSQVTKKTLRHYDQHDVT